MSVFQNKNAIWRRALLEQNNHHCGDVGTTGPRSRTRNQKWEERVNLHLDIEDLDHLEIYNGESKVWNEYWVVDSGILDLYS